MTIETKKFKNPLQNQSGSLTVELIFGIMTALGVGLTLFVVSFSLTTIEISQYIAFASARAQAAANKDVQEQINRGKEKYTNIKDKIFSADSVNWFEFSSPNTAYNWNSNWPSKFPGENTLDIGGGQTFPWAPNRGFGFNVTLKILGVKLPILGSAGEKDSFQTFISALVLRQPSHADCTEFWGPNRGIGLVGMDPRFQEAGTGKIRVQDAYNQVAAMMMENACGPNPL